MGYYNFNLLPILAQIKPNPKLMIIKRTIRYMSIAIAFLGLSSLEACKDDEPSDLCYECDGEDYYGDPIDETLCFSDYKDDMNKEEFTEFIELINDFGYSCSKK